MGLNKWWGYLHVEGTLHVKIFFDNEDLVDAHESPFVLYSYGPWECNNREEALTKLKESLRKAGK